MASKAQQMQTCDECGKRYWLSHECKVHRTSEFCPDWDKEEYMRILAASTEERDKQIARLTAENKMLREIIRNIKGILKAVHECETRNARKKRNG